MKWIWVALLAGACSDDDDVPAFEPSCVEIPWSNPDAYKTAAELGGEPVPGTLARWNPAERYFFTGVYIGNPVRRIDEQLGVSSVRLEVVDGGLLVDGAVPGTLDESQGFYTRDEAFPDGSIRRSSMRISNRASDGSLRADRAVCDGKNCRVCTARLERAKHVDNKPSNRLTLVGELADPTWGPGFTYNVRVAGTMAYLVRDDGLHVIDVADPANPVERGRFPQTGKGRSNDVKIVDAAGGRRYAIIADSPVV
ncbi:MAG TPA: hypothetical protein VK427_09735, partial [Kofleriaceae bacterium]|nr:hypothetical protein [Kofleriaceae bacterium]